MHERNILKIEDNIQINVDCTSDTDEFLILMASVHFEGRSVPLYFSMRNYLLNRNIVQDIQKRFVEDPQLPWNESSWACLCALQSQYLEGYEVPTRK